jgi:hypothetical protein
MNRRLVRAGLLVWILVLAAMETLAFASVARTARLTIPSDSNDLIRAGRLWASVASSVVSRAVARLASNATADAATGAARWAAARLSSVEGEAATAPEGCPTVRCSVRIKVPARSANHTI